MVILDVDGVMVEHHPHLAEYMAAVAREMGMPVEPIYAFMEKFLDGTERGRSPFTALVHHMWGDAVAKPGKAEEYARRFREYEFAHPYPAMAGSIETVQWLRQNDVSVAICSNNERQALMHRLYHADYNERWFCDIIVSDKGYHKPDPRMLNEIFDLTPVVKEHSVFIGDWYPDVLCARAADVPFLAVLSGNVPKRCFIEHGVPEDRIMNRLSDLQTLVIP